MNRPSLPIRLTALLALSTFSAACKHTSSTPSAPPPPPPAATASSASSSQQAGRVELTSDTSVKAVVVSVDRATRVVTLRKPDGLTFTAQADASVRNFDQIAAGDQLNVRCRETLTATMVPGAEATSPTKGAAVVGRAKAGESPKGGVSMAATMRVRITSVDPANSSVVYATDSGEQRTVKASRPEGREFISRLKVGDIVQIDYLGSLAVALEKE